MKRMLLLLGVVVGLSTPAFAQTAAQAPRPAAPRAGQPRAATDVDHILCSTTPMPPFVVTNGAPFTVQWLMPDTATENGINVANRWDGFYVQIDGGPKADVGLATALPECSATSAHPGDIPHSYKTPQGVGKGNHTLKVSAWSFTLDGAGNPTTTRQESVVTQVPFSAGDPVLFGPPVAPISVLITK